MSRPKSILMGTSTYNTHAQNMARALYEAGGLYRYVTGGVDSFRTNSGRRARAWMKETLPSVDRQLTRRSIADVPAHLVHARWGWELPRLAAGWIGASRLEDWCWEHGELALDHYCSRLIPDGGVGAFLGVEHGALESLRKARALGKTGVVTFMSPHHRTRERWVDVEYEKFPELQQGRDPRIERLTRGRDQRRDDEATEAAWIVTNSTFTTRSLVDAGFPAGKILTVPLGGPDPVHVRPIARPRNGLAGTTFVYVGPVSVRKGAHYLLHAWRRVAGPGLSLHFYGKVMLPDRVIREARSAPGGDALVFHGSVPAQELPAVYQAADALVLPTLCDGFGAVVTEALANGLPVITTRNAGAADMVSHAVTGFVIAPADEDALADALQWCVDHGDDLAGMRMAALDRAATHTWRAFREQFRGAIGQTLARVPASRESHSTETRLAR